MFKLFCYLLLLLLCSLGTTPVLGQTNFRAGWKKSDPVAPDPVLALEEKVKAHQDFLNKATLENDTLKRLYGFLYLFYDYANAHNFPEATRYLLEAETIANVSGNPDWQGWVTHRKGVLFVRLKNYKAAIAPYEAAAKLCGEAGDSLCLGESLEQIGAMYSITNDFVRARQYFDRAIPIIKKYGTEASLGATLSNFGGLLSRQNMPKEAIPYLQQSIGIWQKLGRHKEETQAMNNLGEAYFLLHRFEESIEIFNRCIDINTELNLPESLINNYSGLANLYQEKGELEKALLFFDKYYLLKDSVVGAKTQLEIADLEAKYRSQQKELELQKKQIELAKARLYLERGTAVFIFVVLFAGFVFWRWRVQIRRANRRHAQHQENLTNLTRILLDKNALLIDLEKQVLELTVYNEPSSEFKDFEENLYNQRILTDADWAAFKTYFEKANPGYLLRLRTAFPTISDAEKRLFLLIKLHLTNKESATILGISADSVKKTRNRLRKRLGLDEATTLEAYIDTF